METYITIFAIMTIIMFLVIIVLLGVIIDITRKLPRKPVTLYRPLSEERKTPNQIRAEYGLRPINKMEPKSDWDSSPRVSYSGYASFNKPNRNASIWIHTPDFIAYDSSLISAVAQRELYKREAEFWQIFNKTSELDLKKANEKIEQLKTDYENMDKANAELHIEIDRLKTFETFANHVSSLPNCNSCCGRAHCPYRPKLGDDVRFNCPLRIPDVTVKQVGIVFKKEN